MSLALGATFFVSSPDYYEILNLFIIDEIVIAIFLLNQTFNLYGPKIKSFYHFSNAHICQFFLIKK